MEYFIKAVGIKQARASFTRMGYAAADGSPAFRSIANLLMEIEEQIFLSQGRRGGGSWKRDTVDWLERKMRMRLDPRINIATEALMESVTVPGAPGQILKIRRNSMEFGSSIPYAATSQRNRPFIKFTVNDRAEMRDILRDYLLRAFKSGRE